MYLLHTILFLTLTYFPPYAPTITFTRPLDKTSQTKKYKPNNTVNTITKPLDDINSLNVGHLTVFNSLNTFDGEYVLSFFSLLIWIPHFVSLCKVCLPHFGQYFLISRRCVLVFLFFGVV